MRVSVMSTAAMEWNGIPNEFVLGILGFYSGISASWFRQLTYTTARFALYEYGKNFVDANNMSAKFQLATFAGFFGGILGVPGDVVTVRLQNDTKLPPAERRG